jgi:hypothetical protein
MREKVAAFNPSSEAEFRIKDLDIYKCYQQSAYLSLKISSYFRTYDELLSKYRGKNITFVEIGIYNGGSLFMWRNYLGPQARIIGVELNEGARKWEKDGFEIHIGDQADPKFWDDFFAAVGDVDVILDDGGHTNEQQIITTHKAIPHIRDGGMLIVEDTHTSYFSALGNPSKYSFISYAKSLIDSINSRFPSVRASRNDLNKAVLSISFYESIVCIKVDRANCIISSVTSNDGISSDAVDLWDRGSSLGSVSRIWIFLRKTFAPLKNVPFLVWASNKLFSSLAFISARIDSMKLKRYFS